MSARIEKCEQEDFGGHAFYARVWYCMQAKPFSDAAFGPPLARIEQIERDVANLVGRMQLCELQGFNAQKTEVSGI